MKGGAVFLWGMFGGGVAQLISVARYQKRVVAQWPKAMKQPAFWITSLVLILCGGGLALAHASAAAMGINALLAVNIGFTGPLVLEGGMGAAGGKQDLGVWVHHAVEQQVLTRYPGLFAPEEIHSLQNLRGIPAGPVNNAVHLSEIRTMWNEFYRANPAPTRAEVLDFATEVDRKLGVFFKPPVM